MDKNAELLLQSVYNIDVRKCPLCSSPAKIDTIIDGIDKIRIFGRSARDISSALSYATERGWQPIDTEK